MEWYQRIKMEEGVESTHVNEQTPAIRTTIREGVSHYSNVPQHVPMGGVAHRKEDNISFVELKRFAVLLKIIRSCAQAGGGDRLSE